MYGIKFSQEEKEMRKNKSIYQAIMVLLAITLTMTTCNVMAAKVQYPSKPITLIVPFSAGGISDLIARNISEAAKRYTTQPVNVINRPGGSATIGTTEVVTSRPDGYTLLYGSSGELASGLHLVKAPYGLDSYVPFCQIGSMRVALAVNASSKWKDLKEFIAYAKANPKKINIGVPGKGTVVHLTGEYFCQKAKIKLNIVPFQGSGPLIPALLGEHIDAALVNAPEITSQYNAKGVNVLAVFSDERVGVLKDVSTAKEQGFNVIGGASHFIVGPKGVPANTANAIRNLMKQITSDPQFLNNVTNLGYSIKYNDTKTSQKFLKKWYLTSKGIYQKLGMTQ
jgi:tripartite-type tricarboxylate transporter receptor subunit TctC